MRNVSKHIITFFKEHLIVVLLILFFSTEAIGKLETYYFFETGVQRGAKGLVLFVLAIMMFYQFRRTTYVYLIIGLLVVYVIGQAGIDDSFSENSLLILSKFIFPITLFSFFSLYRPNKASRVKLFIFFEWLLVLNSILILLGLLFEIRIFETYYWTRFGYSGLIETSAAASYIYIIALSYFVISFKTSTLTKWKFWIVLVGSLLVGTKAIYLGVFGCAIYLLFSLKGTLKYLLVVVSAITFLIAGYYMLFHVKTFQEIIASEGFLTAILSKRDLLFLDQTYPYIQKYWSGLNYIFGGVVNYDLRSQMTLVDVFFFWGIIGGLYYFFVVYKSYLYFQLTGKAIYFLLLLSLIVLFAGNFFTYSAVAIYLVILRECLIETKNS